MQSKPKIAEDGADDRIEEAPTIQAVTAKEIKNMVRPEFQKNYKNYYPVEIFQKIGFTRHECRKCHKFFWSKAVESDVCGDSMCQGKYSFIGTGTGIGQKGVKLTYSEAWDTFEKSFTNARIPSTKISKYPTVARWRNDVDYVAAGIYCFQPYCVTGEMAPPANPLICPQFCVRFNDLDNIGLTGRHYSGFVMIGIQVFNYPDEYHFFKDECVEFNYNWLTQELGIPDDEITFCEDIWAGGGNMGPSVEYFVRGMEIGNMVFMQFKTFHDGSFEELKIKVIDTGIGLERVAWLINGDATSYISTFKSALQFVLGKLEVSMDNDVWQKLGPLSCMLDVDECEDLEKTWTDIAGMLQMDKAKIKEAIEPIKDIFIILDHTRTAMFLIRDGSLPSNVGGGSNLRNIIRRTFAIMSKNDWWGKLSWDDYMQIFKYHESDLEGLYGKFEAYSSFGEIMGLEHQRWLTTDESQTQKLKKLLVKKPVLSLEDWYTAVTSWGIPSDTIAKISKNAIPDNLYYYIDEKKARIVKAPERILYETSHLPETVGLYYDHFKADEARRGDYEFESSVVEVFANVSEAGRRNIVILDKSGFYPTSGGQANDLGTLSFLGRTYQVVNVEKVGKAVLHFLDHDVPEDFHPIYNPATFATGEKVKAVGVIDKQRRIQLRNHHTAAHIMFAACRQVLGPHVWQQGAKKTPIQAHLDITHYSSLTKEQELLIQETANRVVMDSHSINKTVESKDHAEKEHGFRLYQGGVVPGNSLRVVEIDGVDVEACCGTHCDNTSEVGWIKILTTKRIADGIVRLYFVAGERTIEKLNEETKIIHDLCKLLSIPQTQIIDTAERIFKSYKKLNTDFNDAQKKILDLQVRYVLDNKDISKATILTDEENPTLYFSIFSNYAQEVFQAKKSILFLGKTFLFAYATDKTLINEAELKALLPGLNVAKMNSFGEKSKAVKDILVVSVVSKTKLPDVLPFFTKLGFLELKI